MATNFENFTSGFVVGEDTVGIQAAKITTATQGVTAAFGIDTDAIPTVGAVTAKLAASDLKVASATNADNAAKLGGELPSYYATSTELNAIDNRVSAAEGDIETLESYFTAGSANNAVNATKAAAADKLSTARTISFTNGATGSVEFDGSQNVTAELTIADVPFSALPTTTSASMAADKVMDAENIAAYVTDYVGSKIAGVYRVKGTKTCAQINALTGMEVGDVYNVSDDGTITGGLNVKAGDNVVWAKDSESGAGYWDKLASSTDLSEYYTKTETNTAISKAVADEETRATTAEQANAANIAAEVTRATGKESELATAISTEASTARAAEKANADDIDALDNRVTTAEGDIGTLKTTVGNSSSGLVKDVADLKTSVSTNTSDIGDLKTRMSTAEGEIDTLQSDMTTAKSDIATLKTDVEALERTVGDEESGLVKDVDDLQTSAATLDGKIDAVDDKVDGLKYYSQIKVGNQTASANTSAATFEFVAGQNVSITPKTDAGNPNPQIEISVTGTDISIVGSNGVTATSGDDGYTIAGVDATSAQAGVTKAAYIDSDNLIHLF